MSSGESFVTNYSNYYFPMEIKQNELKKEIIHSGHFMVSVIDEQPDEVGESVKSSPYEAFEPELDEKKEEESPILGFNSTNSPRHMIIEDGLTKLFKCMSLAYPGTITSPKWKTFKGLSLRLKDKIRLNNIIWRAWHIQYINGKDLRVCRFNSPVDCDVHVKPEAIILEGKYWKRRPSTVVVEYSKWRAFYKHRNKPRTKRHSFSEVHNSWFDWNKCNRESIPSDEDFSMDFSDTLFNTLGSTNVLDFPNPREFARLGVQGDFIQPGLLQFQPSIDEYMDPFSDFLSPRINVLPPLPEETAFEATNDNSKNSKGQPCENSLVEERIHSIQSYNNLDQSTLPYPQAPMHDNESKQCNNASSYMDEMIITNSLTQQIKRNESIKMDKSNGQLRTVVAMNSNQRNHVPLSQSLDELNSIKSVNSQYQYKCEFSDSKNISISNIKRDLERKTNQSDHVNKFAVPKVPLKPRARSRSTTNDPGLNAVHSHNSKMLNDINTPKQALIERSNSLPIYSRRNAIGPVMNAQIMQNSQFASNPNLSVRSCLNSNNNLADISPNVIGYGNGTPLNYSNSSSFNSTLIAQLLSSNVGPLGMTHAKPCPPLFDKNNSSTFISHSSPEIVPNNYNTSSGLPMRSSHNNELSSEDPLTSSLQIENEVKEFIQNKTVHKLPSPNSPISLGSQYSPVSKDPNVTGNTVPSPPSLIGTSKNYKAKSEREKYQYKEHRRVCHINAEQKRRCNIKNGFDTLRSLLPSVNQNANTKISKAAMLQKAADYIRLMKLERQQQQEESENLKQQIENLNQAIGIFQSQLPATGAPISCQRTNRIRERFDSYVKERTLENWKFYILSVTVMESLLESFMYSVNTNSIDEMYMSVIRWLDQDCSLPTLRKRVYDALRNLSTSTSIVNNPSSLPEEVIEAITKKHKRNT